MILNYIWIGFFVLALIVCLFKLIFTGDLETLNEVSKALFSSATTAFELALGLSGILTLWMGLLKVGEKSGMVSALAKGTYPFFRVLFPSLPKDHPALGTIILNFSANLLGIDNAATPLGLETMKHLQKENSTTPDRISDAMIMFLCINASGLTLIPISILMYRTTMGAAVPTDVFIPIFIATAASTLFAICAVAYKQKISLFQRAFLIPLLILLFAIVLNFIPWGGDGEVSGESLQKISALIANGIILSVVVIFLVYGLWKKLDVFSVFIEGAKEGFKTAINIVPYLVAILVGVAVFRASGGMDYIVSGIEASFRFFGLPSDWVGALPTMLMKPLSGSGARGLMIDAMQNYGADSFVGRLACMCQGASDTTFYIIALYAGSVAIRNTRYTLGICLLSDFVGMIVSVLCAYFFFAP